MFSKKKITVKNLIIIFIIICVFCICITHTVNYTKRIIELKKYIGVLEQVQEKINEIRNEYKIWENYNPNESGNFNSYLNEKNLTGSVNPYKEEFEDIIKKYDQEKAENWNESIDTNIINYYYFSPENLRNLLGKSDLNYHIIINFYTGNVIEKNGIYDITLNKIIHRQYDSKLGNKLYTNEITPKDIETKIEIIENKGLKQKVKLYLESKIDKNLPDIIDVFYYTDEDETLKSCSYLNDYTYNSLEKAIYFTISTSAKYSFVIKDSNYIMYKKLDYDFNLCNPPILRDDMNGIYWDENNDEVIISSVYDPNWYDYSFDKMHFANAKSSDGNYWVWIPRYSYKTFDDEVEIEYVNTLSKLSTSNRALNGYKVHEAFTEDGEITGFWISKFQGNIDNNKIYTKPGKTLTYIKISEDIKNQIMTYNQKDALLLFQNLNNFKISNDLVHYAGRRYK